MAGLESWYRLLMWAYPARYRHDRGEEMLGTLLDLAGPGRRRPAARAPPGRQGARPPGRLVSGAARRPASKDGSRSWWLRSLSPRGMLARLQRLP
jgi:hypothetical protein